MFTFVTSPRLSECAANLETGMLSAQLAEAKLIYLALTDGNNWENHPAVKMWQNHVDFLNCYGRALGEEYFRRKNRLHKSHEFFASMPMEAVAIKPPWWFEEPLIRENHIARLLWKNFWGYAHKFPRQKPKQEPPIIWPQTYPQSVIYALPDGNVPGTLNSSLCLKVGAVMPVKNAALDL